VSITSRALIDAKMRETRLGEDDVLRLVARAAMVRELARRYPDRFVLKGGALLFHVHKTPRASFVDTDLADPTGDANVDYVQESLLIEGDDGFALKATDGQWTSTGEILKGARIPFSVHEFKAQVKSKGNLTVSVSVRKAEVLDGIATVRFDATDLLADDAIFDVKALSLNELPAEKILGWCLKPDLFKHFADLAILARDHRSAITRDRVQEMLRDKFSAEKQADETRSLYRHYGLARPSDLNKRFLTNERLESIRAGWQAALENAIWLTAAEIGRTDSLTDPDVAIGLVQGFWEPVVRDL
jgi:hypothetical protein